MLERVPYSRDRIAAMAELASEWVAHVGVRGT
jgi:hypothetical protein